MSVHFTKRSLTVFAGPEVLSCSDQDASESYIVIQYLNQFLGNIPPFTDSGVALALEKSDLTVIIAVQILRNCVVFEWDSVDALVCLLLKLAVINKKYGDGENPLQKFRVSLLLSNVIFRFAPLLSLEAALIRYV